MVDPSQPFSDPVLSPTQWSLSLSFCGEHRSMSEFSLVSLALARHPEDSTKIPTCFGRDLPLVKGCPWIIQGRGGEKGFYLLSMRAGKGCKGK